MRLPFVQLTTREPISQETKASLAGALSDALLTIEVGKPTEGGKAVDWMWFRFLPEDDWAVGGEFSGHYVRGKTMCHAQIIAPEALMNNELKHKAISEVTRILREGLVKDPNDYGSGIWVIITEVPGDQWGSGGKTMTLPQLIEVMEGDVSQSRRAAMQAYVDGLDHMKKRFGTSA